MNLKSIRILLIIGLIFPLLLDSYLFCRDSNESIRYENFHNGMTGTKYHSSDDGILRIFINVWGNVSSPGRLIIDEGVDIITAISMAGGPTPGADLKNIQLFRELPDEDNISVYKINLQNYIKTGDRNELIIVKPNDTIIIPQKTSSYIFDKMATVNTFMSLISLYYTIQNNK